MAEKLKMHSPDLVMSNIERIAELFPNCVTEAAGSDGQITRKIDFDLLRQELSDEIVEGPLERYHLNWPGKREAMLAANAPIAKTLRPCREASVDFDTTQNLFIEGDNLEALKLLQETYLGKVKMIYIDPPYNTGKDFVYNDNFGETTSEYFRKSGQQDEDGTQQSANTHANGRFHSAWLTMIYPRMKLARNLLTQDGVVFISIDDGEVSSLRRICDEIFGEENFLGNIVWQKTYSPANDKKGIDAMHDHVLAYQKDASRGVFLLPREDKQNDAYRNPDNDSRGPWKAVDATRAEHRDYAYFAIETPSGEEVYPADGRSWVFTKEELPKLLADNRLWFGTKGNSKPSKKLFLSEVKDGVTPTTWWPHDVAGHNDEAKKELKKLFSDRPPFQTPKPTRLLERAIRIATQPSSHHIVMDFFAGSATTAHALYAMNAAESGNRRFILVQLPESLGETTTELAHCENIADIAMERIRRAGNQVKENRGVLADGLDFGFRVLRIDSSNMKDVYYSPADTSQSMLSGLVDNIKPDRTGEDLLFQVLLDCGVDLGLPIKSESIDGCEVFFVNDSEHAAPDLVACFDPDVPESLVKTIAAKSPLRAVFRDQCFATDADKINVEQIFKQLSPQTQLRSL
jgi:adenine-specific DNA-methyltransferase